MVKTPSDEGPIDPSSSAENTPNEEEPTDETWATEPQDSIKDSSDTAEASEVPEDAPKEAETTPSDTETESEVPKDDTSSNEAVLGRRTAHEEAVVRPRRVRGPRSMKDLKIGKVVVNITTGQSGEPLDRAMTILENLTGQRPSTRRAKQTIRTWGIRRGEPIACMVTLRGEKADDFLRKTLPAVGNRIRSRSFDRNGNFAFGIREHIDIPGQRYDPSLGIVGMDVMATVERAGFRVARRRRARSRVGRRQKVTREESIEFIKQSFGVEVGLPSE